MTFAGSDRLLGSTGDNPEIEHEINFGYVPGTDEAAADADLRSAGLEIFLSEAAVLPPSVANLGQVADIPLWIAAYLGILGLSALGHGLVVGVGSQRREFVILRALGLRRRGAVAIIAIQVLAMAGLAAVAGLPIGMLVSRRLWHLLATDAHVVVETVWPWGTILALGLGALVAASLLGTVVAARSMYGHRALALRTE